MSNISPLDQVVLRDPDKKLFQPAVRAVNWAEQVASFGGSNWGGRKVYTIPSNQDAQNNVFLTQRSDERPNDDLSTMLMRIFPITLLAAVAIKVTYRTSVLLKRMPDIGFSAATPAGAQPIPALRPIVN